MCLVSRFIVGIDNTLIAPWSLSCSSAAFLSLRNWQSLLGNTNREGEKELTSNRKLSDPNLEGADLDLCGAAVELLRLFRMYIS